MSDVDESQFPSTNVQVAVLTAHGIILALSIHKFLLTRFDDIHRMSYGLFQTVFTFASLVTNLLHMSYYEQCKFSKLII